MDVRRCDDVLVMTDWKSRERVGTNHCKAAAWGRPSSRLFMLHDFIYVFWL